ncbi:DUF4258 domain-containing protein [Aeropyrum pernix]|uniref:DUF4258 domain-containing protein n=1 Tax=Aeropyrum pernix TaxID=56636 RepID=UPI0011E5226F|nr:DUF4258 domain-containing protein [Aeropyrum pernix]
MKIFYTLHALERLRQRGITREQVEQCLREPDKIEELEGLYRCIKRLNDKVLVTIYKEFQDRIMIITAFKTSKIKKYLP